MDLRLTACFGGSIKPGFGSVMTCGPATMAAQT